MSVFFNKRICEQYGWNDRALYDKVYDGTWVIDDFIEIVSGIYEDVDGDGTGSEEGPKNTTVILAGEEHPASVDISRVDGNDYLSACLYIPKGDFEYIIYLSGPDLKPEDLTKYFEKP